jgi:predicted unusual protein kinase regulating ubiquinone biosynthesis (AarF/ABC1/UbiB family)
LTGDWALLEESFAEIRRMLRQEVDYLQELKICGARGVIHAGDGIVVPKVYGDSAPHPLRKWPAYRTS